MDYQSKAGDQQKVVGNRPAEGRWIPSQLQQLLMQWLNGCRHVQIAEIGWYKIPNWWGYMDVIRTSHGLGTWFQRPWQTGLSRTLFTWWRIDTLSSCLVFTNAFDRVLIFIRSRNADPHSWNRQGCWEAVSQSCCLFREQWLGVN